jgi:hypothetical protein
MRPGIPDFSPQCPDVRAQEVPEAIGLQQADACRRYDAHAAGIGHGGSQPGEGNPHAHASLDYRYSRHKIAYDKTLYFTASRLGFKPEYRNRKPDR